MGPEFGVGRGRGVKGAVIRAGVGHEGEPGVVELGDAEIDREGHGVGRGEPGPVAGARAEAVEVDGEISNECLWKAGFVGAIVFCVLTFQHKMPLARTLHQFMTNPQAGEVLEPEGAEDQQADCQAIAKRHSASAVGPIWGGHRLGHYCTAQIAQNICHDQALVAAWAGSGAQIGMQADQRRGRLKLGCKDRH